jgi:hypothetical protein
MSGLLKRFEGVPRSDLEEKILSLENERAALDRENARVCAEYKLLDESNTAFQIRGTELLDELRQLRVERQWAGTQEGRLLYEALNELRLARAKHPGPFTLDYMLAVLSEEVGEVARARTHDEGAKSMRLELAQVIGVCMRIYAEQLP